MDLSRAEQKLIEDAGGLSMSLGLGKASFENEKRILSHIPISFYPYLIHADVYNKLKSIHFIWQKLFTKLSIDGQFLKDVASKFCTNDPYMQKLFQIYLNNDNKMTRVACTRVDYMGDEQPKLVQYNLMSIGLNGISDKIQNLHSIFNKYVQPKGKYTYPASKNQETICKALLLALQLQNLKQGLILMVVHEKQFNYGDHHAFKMQMLKQGRQAQPVTMAQLIQKMKYNEETNEAFLDQRRIDAFYFRTGYALNHFPTQQHWKIREKIQKSRSIKLPTIQMILINTKRMQSQLSKEKVLSKYLSQFQVKLIKEVSGQIHDFDDKTQQQIAQLVKNSSKQDYVLKPNRQGGGNNFFGHKANQKFKQLIAEKDKLKNYILMKKINCQARENYFIFDHKPMYIQKATAQFSTLGCFVYKNGQVISNQMGGTLVRLKRAQAEEGGIAINQGAVSGICIINYQ